MTHEEILKSIMKISTATVGDYISLALAQGWTKVEVAEILTRHIESMEGINCWSKITRLVDSFEKYYAVGSKEEPSLYDEYQHGGNPDFILSKRPIEIDGIIYESIKDASSKLGKSESAIRGMLEIGWKVYAYDGKVYKCKKDLKNREKLTETEYRTRLKKGLVTTWKVPMGRYL